MTDADLPQSMRDKQLLADTIEIMMGVMTGQNPGVDEGFSVSTQRALKSLAFVAAALIEVAPADDDREGVDILRDEFADQVASFIREFRGSYERTGRHVTSYFGAEPIDRTWR